MKTFLETQKKLLGLLEKYVHENLTKDGYVVGKAVRTLFCFLLSSIYILQY